MPSSTHFRTFLWIFAALCLAALTLVLLDNIRNIAWAKDIVAIGHSLGRLVFVATALTFILVEGGYALIGYWLHQQDIKRAREQERQRLMDRIRNHPENETTEELIARLEAENRNREKL